MHAIPRAAWALALASSLFVAAAAQQPVRIEPQQTFQPGGLHFLPGSAAALLVSDSGGTLRIVDFTDPARPVVRLTFPEKVRGAVVLPDGRIAAGTGDGLVRFWSQTGAETEPALAMLGRAIGPLAVSRGGRWLAAGDAAGMVRIWRRDGAAWSTVTTFQAMPARGDCDWSTGIDGLAFSPDETLLAVSTCPGGLALWTVEGRRIPAEAPESTQGGLNTDLVFSGDGRHLLAHYRFQPGSQRWAWPIEGAGSAARVGTPRMLDNSRTGAIVAHPRDDGFVIAEADAIAFRAPDGRELRPRLKAVGVTSIAVTADGSRLAAVQGWRIRIWDAAGQPVPPERFDEGSLFWRVLPLRDRFVAAYPDGSIRFWRWSGAPIGHAIPVTSARREYETNPSVMLALLPDGETIAATDTDGVVRFFDADGKAKGKPLQLLYPRDRDGAQFETEAAFGRDGLVATTAFRTSLLRLGYDGRWATESFARHRGPILAIAQRTSDGLLATADYHHLRFWSATGEPVGEPIPLRSVHITRKLSFSPDGRMLVVGPGLAIWRADAPDRLEQRGGSFVGYVDGGFVWTDRNDILLETPAGLIPKLLRRNGDKVLAAAPDGSGVLVEGPGGVRFRHFDAPLVSPPTLWAKPAVRYVTARPDGTFDIEFERETLSWTPAGTAMRSQTRDATLWSPDRKWRFTNAPPGYRAQRADGSGVAVELPGSYIFFARDGGFIATAFAPGRRGVYFLRLYDGDLKLLLETSFEGEHYGRIAMAPDGSQIAVWAGTRIRFVDRAGRWSERSVEAGNPLDSLSLDYAPNGRWLAAIDPAKRLLLIDRDGNVLARKSVGAGLKRLAIAGDSASLVAYDADARLSAWPVDPESGRLGELRAMRDVGGDYALAFDFRRGRLWLQRDPNEIALFDGALNVLARAYYAPDGGWLVVLPDGRHCGAGPIFAGRQAYRGADLLRPAARDALVDCAAVKAAFDS
jgi:WD40 repeat protein